MEFTIQYFGRFDRMLGAETVEADELVEALERSATQVKDSLAQEGDDAEREARYGELIRRELETLQQLDRPDLVAGVDDVEDDVLRLIFMTCHPVLSREARVALTLRLLGGLSTPEIARSFLVSEGTVAQLRP